MAWILTPAANWTPTLIPNPAPFGWDVEVELLMTTMGDVVAVVVLAETDELVETDEVAVLTFTEVTVVAI